MKRILVLLTFLFLIVNPVSAKQNTPELEPNIILDVNKTTHVLTVIKDGTTIESYDIIIGKKVTPTPDFEATFITIDINPTWNPSKRVQHRLKERPEIMKKDGIVIAPDGDMYSPPGKDNPLGKARLNIRYTRPIKIHGTNEPELFKTKTREYSLGCIRVLEIQDLVQKITNQDIDWNRAYLIKLDRPVRVIVH